MTTNLVHNGGQRTTHVSAQLPTFTWNASGSWTNSFGEIRSYDNSTDRDAWEQPHALGQTLDINHNNTTYYVAYKPNNTSNDVNDWPTLVLYSGAYHIANVNAADWWDRFISFDETAFKTALANSSNGTFSSGGSGINPLNESSDDDDNHPPPKVFHNFW